MLPKRISTAGSRYLFAGFVALILLLEYAIFFWRAGHFFQGDTIYWFYYRLTSISDFFRSFVAADPGGWYRPLTNRTLESLLYPLFSFEPARYRWVTFLIFSADTALLFGLTLKLSRSGLAAMIATLFFSIHTINAYTTYDLSFTPELVYSLFYMASALAFLSYLQNGEANRWIWSLAFFGLSLCSKESAVTLPATLLVLAILYGNSWKRAAASVAPHSLMLAVYLIFAIAHLGVASEALASMKTRPAVLETGGYYFFVGPHILTNAALAWQWALNLPVGMLGQWRLTTRLTTLYLQGFAGLQMLLIIYALTREDRKAVLAGLAWFWIATLPALPLFAHFLPYYMFLPVLGFAMMAGASWNAFYRLVSSRWPLLGAAAMALTFALLTFVCARSSRSEARNNFLLGSSSRIAENSLRDLQRLYPTIPVGTTIFVNNDAQPDLWWHQAQGKLFNLVYGDDSLQFRYSSLNQLPDNDTESARTLRLIFKDGHLEKE